MQPFLNLFDLWRQCSRRFEVKRTPTGNESYFILSYFICYRVTHKKEYEVLTNLPSHDITDEYHLEWVTVSSSWHWGWK